MKVLLVDRLGFERVTTGDVCKSWIVPRRFQPGQSVFEWYGKAIRDGDEVIEYRERDDTSEELKAVHETADYLRREIRRLKSVIRGLEEENGAMALELRRKGARTT